MIARAFGRLLVVVLGWAMTVASHEFLRDLFAFVVAAVLLGGALVASFRILAWVLQA